MEINTLSINIVYSSNQILSVFSMSWLKRSHYISLWCVKWIYSEALRSLLHMLVQYCRWPCCPNPRLCIFNFTLSFVVEEISRLSRQRQVCDIRSEPYLASVRGTWDSRELHQEDPQADPQTSLVESVCDRWRRNVQDPAVLDLIHNGCKEKASSQADVGKSVKTVRHHRRWLHWSRAEARGCDCALSGRQLSLQDDMKISDTHTTENSLPLGKALKQFRSWT